MINNFLPKFFGRFLFQKEFLGKVLSDYFTFKLTKAYWIVIASVNLLLWLLAFLIKRGLPQDLVILHYNTTFGIDYLAPPKQIYWLPAIALVLFLFNACWSLAVFKKDDFLVNVLLLSALAVNLVVGLGLYSIYLVNFVKIF